MTDGKFVTQLPSNHRLQFLCLDFSFSFITDSESCHRIVTVGWPKASF